MESYHKIFLSVLGTNDYIPCNYFFTDNPDKMAQNVRFVQEAILYIERDKWQDGKIIIFTTEDAEKKNWQDDGHVDRDGNILERQGLETRLKNLGVNYEKIRIPDGKSEEEIWEIFRAIVAAIPESSTIEIDITHSFRSLTIIQLAVVNYSKAAKGITVDRIHYGAMESLGPIYEVKKMPHEQRNVPIFDLTPFDTIMSWAHAVNDFKISGSAEHISRLAMGHVKPILAATKGEDREASAVRHFAKRLNQFCDAIALNRAPEIKNAAHEANSALEAVKSTSILPPIVPLLDDVAQALKRFERETVATAVEAAKWCVEHNFIPQGYAILQESLITWFLEKIGKKDAIMDHELRGAVSSALSFYSQKSPAEKIKEELHSHADMIEDLLSIPELEQLSPIFERLRAKRNNISHAGFNRDLVTPGNFRQELQRIIKDLQQLISAQAEIQAD